MSASPAPNRWQQLGMDGLWALVLSMAVIVLTGGISWLLVLLRVAYVAVRSPTKVLPSGWIIVLGRRLLGSAVTLEYAARLWRAKQLLEASPGCRIMVLGGFSSEGPFSEAEQGKRFLQQRGIASESIHTEDRSLHTLENLQNGRELIGEHADAPLVLVTSRYHLARCQTIAKGMGIAHEVCAAEDSWLFSFKALYRLAVEAFFVHWYWVGRIWSTLTFNRKSLARIS